MYDENFAKRLNEIIQTLGGVGKACKAAGVSQPTLDRWKKGTSEPLAVNLSKLTRQAGVSMDWLIYGEGEMGNGSQASADNDREYAHVPFYRTEASAGHGAFLDEQREPTHHLAFRWRWLKAHGFALKDLVGLIARGDSMEPTIKDGAAVIINTATKDPADGNVYVIRVGDRLWIKRTQWLLDGSLRLNSDNNFYESMDISVADLEHGDIEVVGQAVHTAYDLVK